MAAKINSKRIKKIKTLLSNNSDSYHCCFCIKEFKLTELTIEHILPKSYGGTNQTINLALSCSSCNNDRNNSNFSAYRDYKLGIIKKKPEGSRGRKRKMKDKDKDNNEYSFHTKTYLDHDGYVLYTSSWCKDLIISNLFEKYPDLIKK